jgi:flagellar hook-basal body complex protein FliE
VDALNQINGLRVGGQVGTTTIGKPVEEAGAGGVGQVSFKDVLMKNLNEVNQLQEDADKVLQDYVTGKSQNMGEVISASQKASLAFSMLTQIRNQLQDAYDEVKNLRI